MNKEDLERIANMLLDFSYASSELRRDAIKCKEIEVSEEISESLKSIASSLNSYQFKLR